MPVHRILPLNAVLIKHLGAKIGRKYNFADHRHTSLGHIFQIIKLIACEIHSDPEADKKSKRQHFFRLIVVNRFLSYNHIWYQNCSNFLPMSSADVQSVLITLPLIIDWSCHLCLSSVSISLR